MGARVPSKSKASSGARAAPHPAPPAARTKQCFIVVLLVSVDSIFDALVQAQSAGVGQHAPGPSIDVELAHRHAQACHAFALLGVGHGQARCSAPAHSST
jgi:hypothetical protein